MRINHISTLFFAIIFGCMLGCSGSQDNQGGDNKSQETVQETQEKKQENNRPEIPDFNADSAYHFIEKQLSFGPRVPNTPAHKEAAEYLTEKLRSYADSVSVQNGTVKAYNNRKLYIQNIRASFQPEKNKKVMLCAHWDTRPVADRDTARTEEPIPGANDGGSGTAVLLEIARQLSIKKPNVGVEIVLFDAEDYGAPEANQKPGQDNKFCLGSKYWAERIDANQYFADYGILLDMVGAKNAVFKREGYSRRYAPQVVDKVWNTASQLGYDNYFSFEKTGPVTDDHVNVIQEANIPCINIIDFDSRERNSFPDHWHTHRDDLDVISKQTLKAVGQTTLTVLFEERGSGA